MNAAMLRAMRGELIKEALLKEIVALGAKDIPGTPRLLMKARDTAQRAALGMAADRGYGRLMAPVSAPLKRGFDAIAKRVPDAVPELIKKKGRDIAEDVVGDPFGGTLTAVAPGGFVIPFLKKGLRKAIQTVDPAATRLMAQPV